MSDPRLPDYLDHIRRATAGAQQYLEGTELSEFLEDEFVQDAVMMKFIVMGEAATRILNRYPDFAENHPEIPWRQMRGMRNRMAHGYFDIDYETVWVTAQEFLTDVLRDQNQTAPQEWTDHDRTKHCGRLNGQNAATHRSATPPPPADTVCQLLPRPFRLNPALGFISGTRPDGCRCAPRGCAARCPRCWRSVGSPRPGTSRTHRASPP